MKKLVFWFPLLIIVTLLLMSAGRVTTRPVYAAGCSVNVSMVPVIDTVQPNTIRNDQSNMLTITGSNFEDGVVVVIEGYGALDTTCVNDTLIRAEVPAGIPGKPKGKVYDVTVINPTDAVTNRATRVKVLTVIRPELVTTPDGTKEPTATPLPTAFARPLVVIESYGASSAVLQPGHNIDFEMTFRNQGEMKAAGLTVTFTAGDLTPRATGGVIAIGTLDQGASHRIFQPFTVSQNIDDDLAILIVEVEYTDIYGTPYTETFTLSFPVKRPVQSNGPTPTPTIVPNNRPQLIIGGYRTDITTLLPGKAFSLTLDIANQGTRHAKQVTMIVGGTIDAEGNVVGGEFKDFSPVGTSNVKALGDVESGGQLLGIQDLVVNVSTEPGAYPLNVVFSYTDENGNPYVDQQTITLLVYSNVQVDVTTYREPDPLFVGQPGILPLQVVNSGRVTVILGTMEVTIDAGQVMPSSTLIGLLDMGGFYIADVTIIPDTVGPVSVTITLNYTDDFNEPRTIIEVFPLEVMEGAIFPEPVDNGEPPPDNGPSQEETFIQKLWRFVRGLLGLNSGLATNEPIPAGDGFQQVP